MDLVDIKENFTSLLVKIGFIRNDCTLYRCQTCGKLLGKKMIAKGICAGHKVIYATNGSVWEFIQIKIGMIK